MAIRETLWSFEGLFVSIGETLYLSLIERLCVPNGKTLSVELLERLCLLVRETLSVVSEKVAFLFERKPTPARMSLQENFLLHSSAGSPLQGNFL